MMVNGWVQLAGASLVANESLWLVVGSESLRENDGID